MLAAEIGNTGIEIDETHGSGTAPEQLYSAILQMRSAGKTQKITFLRITDATLEIIVPLVSMALAAWAGDTKAVYLVSQPWQRCGRI